MANALPTWTSDHWPVKVKVGAESSSHARVAAEIVAAYTIQIEGLQFKSTGTKLRTPWDLRMLCILFYTFCCFTSEADIRLFQTAGCKIRDTKNRRGSCITTVINGILRLGSLWEWRVGFIWGFAGVESHQSWNLKSLFVLRTTRLKRVSALRPRRPQSDLEAQYAVMFGLWELCWTAMPWLRCR